MRSLPSPPNTNTLHPYAGQRPPLTEVVRDTAADLVTLVTAEVKLARLELLAGARQMVGRAGWIIAGVIPLLIGYLAGVAAFAVWLSTFWGWPGGLAATAVSQAILGGALLWATPSTSPVVRRPAASPMLNAGGKFND